MAIPVACSECGKRYRVDVHFARKRFTCKRCGAKVRVPSADYDELSESATFRFLDDALAEEDARPLTPPERETEG